MPMENPRVAFVLVRAIGDVKTLMNALAKEKNIFNIYNVAGDIDLLVEVRNKSIEGLRDVLNRIRSTKNVISTTSYIVLVKRGQTRKRS